MRGQYDYFECEASNGLPPAISKQFKIDVDKVFVASHRRLPLTFTFDCLVQAFPMGHIYWTQVLPRHQPIKHHHTNSNKVRHTVAAAAVRLAKDRHHHRRQSGVLLSASDLDRDATALTNNNNKYLIDEVMINETYKRSSLTIRVDSEHEFGTYECYTNNSIGHRVAKFLIHGGKWFTCSFHLYSAILICDIYFINISYPCTEIARIPHVKLTSTSSYASSSQTNDESNVRVHVSGSSGMSTTGKQQPHRQARPVATGRDEDEDEDDAVVLSNSGRSIDSMKESLLLQSSRSSSVSSLSAALSSSTVTHLASVYAAALIAILTCH